ncbi:MAG: 6-phosphofructokinase [Candidatus Desulfatibia sp.]|uniref:6-phosphofructokinase n=1 Tax=Candidatus Desulfatibia sp. TaxID=3101189 RepID=UPI002F2EF152
MESLNKWIGYKQAVLSKGNLEEVVLDEDLLSLARQEREADPAADLKLLKEATPKLRSFVYKELIGKTHFHDPEKNKGKPPEEYIGSFEDYKRKKAVFIERECNGRQVIFDMAWNYILQNSDKEFHDRLMAFYTYNFGLNVKEISSSPLIIEEKKLSKEMMKNKIIIHLPEGRMILLPKKARIMVLSRHGESVHNSNKKKVGRRCKKGQVITESGKGKAKELSAKMADALGIVQKTAMAHGISIDMGASRVTVSESPNTRQVAEIFLKTFSQRAGIPSEKLPSIESDPANNSQDFGLETNLPKTMEKEMLQTATGLSADETKKFISNPFRIFLGSGAHKIDYYLEDILSLRKRMETGDESALNFAFTHSSRLNNILIFLDKRPFHEAYETLSKERESVETSIMIAYNPETRAYTAYDALVGETTIRKKQRIEFPVEITREEIKRIGILFSGGVAPGMNNILKSVIITCEKHEVDLAVIRNGLKGLTLDLPLYGELPQDHFHHLLGAPGARPGAGRYPEFTNPGAVEKTIYHIRKRRLDFLICVGGDGTMQAAMTLSEKGVPAVGIQSSIDNDGHGYTIGEESAASHNADKINSFHKPDSGAMIDYVYDVVVMGRDSGHLASDTAILTGPAGLFVPEIVVTQEIIKRVAKKIICGFEIGNSHVIVRSEHHTLEKVPILLKKEMEMLLGHTVKIATEIIGREQRNANVVYTDGQLAQKMGFEAVKVILQNPSGTRGKALASFDKDTVNLEDLPYVIANPNSFDIKMYYEWLEHYGSLTKEDEKNLASL